MGFSAQSKACLDQMQQSTYKCMVRGIAPLLVGWEDKAPKWVLFQNKTEKMVPILLDDVIASAKFAKVGHINQEWLDHMYS